jgi:hypothetical protein
MSGGYSTATHGDRRRVVNTGSSETAPPLVDAAFVVAPSLV